jgi:hypothetical protein
MCIPPISQSYFYTPTLQASSETERTRAFGYITGSCTTNYTDNIPSRRFYVGDWDGERVVVNYKTETYGSTSNVYVERMYPEWRSPLLASGSNNVGSGRDVTDCSIISGSETESIYWDDNENPYVTGGPFVSGRYTPVYTNAALTTENCGAAGGGKYYKVTFSSGSRSGEDIIMTVAKPIGGRPCSFIGFSDLNCN